MLRDETEGELKLRRHLVLLKGRRVPVIVDAERWELATVGKIEMYRFLVVDAEVATFPAREVQGVQVDTGFDESKSAPVDSSANSRITMPQSAERELLEIIRARLEAGEHLLPPPGES